MKTTWPGFLLGPLGAKVPQTRRFCQKVRTVTPIRFVSKLRFLFGGEGGIRTLDTLVGYTRFPIVRLRPAQPSLRARKSMTDSNAGLILSHSVPPVNEFLNCRACFFALCRENGEKREGKDCTNRRHCAILCISRGVSTDCLYAARGQWAHAFMYNRDTPEVHSLPALPS